MGRVMTRPYVRGYDRAEKEKGAIGKFKAPPNGEASKLLEF